MMIISFAARRMWVIVCCSLGGRCSMPKDSIASAEFGGVCCWVMSDIMVKITV